MNIEKNIPLPRARTIEPTHSFLNDMEINDSVFLEGVTSHASGFKYRPMANRLKIKIAVRQVEGGSRIWRVA